MFVFVSSIKKGAVALDDKNEESEHSTKKESRNKPAKKCPIKSRDVILTLPMTFLYLTEGSMTQTISLSLPARRKKAITLNHSIPPP